jgi:UDPglucose 6-dehydrogenase
MRSRVSDHIHAFRHDEDARNICVIGAGYVGLPLAAVFADRGHSVTIAERDMTIADSIRQGVSPFLEHGLAELLVQGLSSGRLRVTESAAEGVNNAEFVFLCVGTPESADGSADTSHITRVAAEISPHLAEGAIVINKSTSPIGTVKLIERLIGRPDITVVCNPEFLREGTAVADSINPDRIVVGADNQEAAARVIALFKNSAAPTVVTDTTTAELIKYASNAFLATKLTFINSMAGLCDRVGADVIDLGLGLGYDSRIGFEFMRPGPGWGGSCLPKDTSALVAIAESFGYDLELVRASISGNVSQMDRVVYKIRTAAGGDLRGRIIGVLGLTFKANTNDRRNSPAIWITQRLAEEGATIHAYDPTVAKDSANVEDLLHLTVFDDPYSAVAQSHVVALLTEWQEFRWLDFTRIHDDVASASIVDARNVLDSASLHRLGFSYVGIGR